VYFFVLVYRAVTGLLEAADAEDLSSKEAASGSDYTPEAVRGELLGQRKEIEAALGFRALSVLR
jgi:hypothetical protein